MGEKRIDICNFYKKEISEPNKNGYPSEMGGNGMGWMGAGGEWDFFEFTF